MKITYGMRKKSVVVTPFIAKKAFYKIINLPNKLTMQ